MGILTLLFLLVASSLGQSTATSDRENEQMTMFMLYTAKYGKVYKTKAEFES